MGGLKKYRALIISITLFLLVIAAVSGANLYIARDLNQDAIGVNLSGRQRMLSQRIAKTILQLQEALRTGADPSAAHQELALAVKLFDQTLNGFRNGATVTGGDGKPVLLQSASVGQDKVEEALKLWDPYKQFLSAIVDFDGAITNPPDAEKLAPLVAYAVANNVKILTLMNDLVTALERQATQRAATLRTIQIAALGTALLIFAYIVFFSLRRLRAADQEVLAAKQETDNILMTVNDGLFLIDRHFRIGSQQSKSLTQIFGIPNLAGQNLKDVLAKLVPEKTVDTARTFIDLLFGERVKESLMGDVNPLREVEISFTNAQGNREQRYLAFEFRRVLTNEKLTHLLVAVSNVTSKIELRRELEITRRRNEEQVALLTKMMHIGGAELGAFMDKTQNALDQMNSVLASSGTSRTENMSKITQLFRLVHTIKGDAAALEFDPIESWAHRFEDLIHDLRKREEISGADLLPLTVSMREMYQQITGIRDLVAKLANIRTTLGESAENRSTGISNVWSKAQSIAPKIADREGKRVKVEVNREPGLKIPQDNFHDISDVLVQLVRNSIVHGVESPEQRAAMGKPAEGTVSVYFGHSEHGFCEFYVEDDGAGIDFEKIRALAIERQTMDPQSAATASSKDLVRQLFLPGFSTAAGVTADAGRGVGLDVVEKSVRKMGGKLSINTRRGQGTRFSVLLPNSRFNGERAA